MINIEDLTFAYSGQPPMFQGYSLKIQRNEALSIIGPSGCGKTTLLYLLAGLRHPQSGRILIDQIPIKRPRPRSGLVLQDHGLLPWQTVRENARLGPPRVTQSGLIPPGQVKTGIVVAIVLSTIPGLYLASVAGWPVILIGLLCFAAALAYSGGPFPLASHGLGDLFVFIFFGLVAVCGTYYVQTLQLTPMVWLMGAIQGLLITAILVVNNIRDIRTDRRSGKRTLAVIIGERGSRIEYLLLLATAYAIPFILWQGEVISAWVILPVFSLPLAIYLTRLIWKSAGGPLLNEALASTAKLVLIYSCLLSIGLILSIK